jgi:hypothetical protein
MDRQQIGLKLTLDALGLPARLDSFSDRLVLQKAIYLAQAAGVLLGYGYNWYLRGPYSPSLTRDAFAVVDELRQGVDDSEGSHLDSTSVQRLESLRKLLRGIPQQDLPARLELLASVRFLLGPSGGRMSAPDLKTILGRYGKSYTADQIQHAIEELKQHGLLANARR